MDRNPRYQGYTDTELACRQKVAVEAAVEWPQLGGPSSYANRWTRTNRSSRTMAIEERDDASKSASALPTLILGSVESAPHLRPMAPTGKSAMRATKTPTSQGTNQGIRVNLMETGKVGTKKGTRRGRKKKSRERPVPAYWTPSDPHLGGKSMSTLWGYGLGMSVK